MVKRRAWKKLDSERLKEHFAPPPRRSLNTEEKVDAYVREMTSALQAAIDSSVPWAKSSPLAKPFWDEECERAVKDARKARRKWNEDHTEESWEAFGEACKVKKKIIARAKRGEFRRNMREATESPEKIWKLARWAKNKSHAPKEIPKMPTLCDGEQSAITFDEKINMLKKHLFPAPSEPDLSDMENPTYPAELNCPLIITPEEIIRAINRQSPDKAPGPDGIPNRVLKSIAGPLTEWLLPLIEACIALAYHPIEFKKANAIALKKPGKNKADYTKPGAYRPISLLNTMGKILETVMAKRLSFLAESFRLLPDCQFGARTRRSTETALEFLTEQIHTVWNQGRDKVASLLSLDVASAFPTVSHKRLIHDLRMKGIPLWITNWVNSFLVDRTTTLAINGRRSEAFAMETGVPQGSPLSPILYLFYNADLLTVCNITGKRTSTMGFADDINILAYGISTEANCRALLKTHDVCEKWARTHGAKFNPDKYDLLHLTRSPKKFNIKKTITIQGNVIKPKEEIRILGLQFDSKLNWKAHLKKIQRKMTTQKLALSRLTASTWGASMLKARTIFKAVVRPAITYASSIWRSPEGLTTHLKRLENKLRIIQNSCLRTVSGAYKATPIRVLEAESFIEPLAMHMNYIQAKFRERMKADGSRSRNQEACGKIINRMKKVKGRRRKATLKTPGQRKYEWAEALLPLLEDNPQPKWFHSPWTQPTEDMQSEERLFLVERRCRDKKYATHFFQTWRQAWDEYRMKVPHPNAAQKNSLSARNLKLHLNMEKAVSSLAVQMRTEKIGFADFLYRRKVPGVESAACRCGYPRETVKHVLLFCPDRPDREHLRGAGPMDFAFLMETNKGLRAAAKWVMDNRLLAQFEVAKDLVEHEAEQFIGG